MHLFALQAESRYLTNGDHANLTSYIHVIGALGGVVRFSVVRSPSWTSRTSSTTSPSPSTTGLVILPAAWRLSSFYAVIRSVCAGLYAFRIDRLGDALFSQLTLTAFSSHNKWNDVTIWYFWTRLQTYIWTCVNSSGFFAVFCFVW